MTDTTAAHYVVNKLLKERERIKERLTNGMNQNEYLRTVGQAEGLAYAMALINDTMKRVANDEELTDE